MKNEKEKDEKKDKGKIETPTVYIFTATMVG